jgi:hypothetical protein
VISPLALVSAIFRCAGSNAKKFVAIAQNRQSLQPIFHDSGLDPFKGAYWPEICNQGPTQPATPPRRKTDRGIFKRGSQANPLPSSPIRSSFAERPEFVPTGAHPPHRKDFLSFLSRLIKADYTDLLLPCEMAEV